MKCKRHFHIASEWLSLSLGQSHLCHLLRFVRQCWLSTYLLILTGTYFMCKELVATEHMHSLCSLEQYGPRQKKNGDTFKNTPHFAFIFADINYYKWKRFCFPRLPCRRRKKSFDPTYIFISIEMRTLTLEAYAAIGDFAYCASNPFLFMLLCTGCPAAWKFSLPTQSAVIFSVMWCVSLLVLAAYEMR